MEREELFEISGELQGVANAVEGAQLVAIAHAGSHESRLTDRGLVEVHHGVGFVDAMASSLVSLEAGIGQWAAGRGVAGREAVRTLPELLGQGGRRRADHRQRRQGRLRLRRPRRRRAPRSRTCWSTGCPGSTPPGSPASSARSPPASPPTRSRRHRGRTARTARGGLPRARRHHLVVGPAAHRAVRRDVGRHQAPRRPLATDNPSLTLDQARADALADLVLSNVTVTAKVTLGIPVITGTDADTARDTAIAEQGRESTSRTTTDATA